MTDPISPTVAQRLQKVKKIVESTPVEGWHYYVHQAEWDYLLQVYGEDWVNERCMLIQPLESYFPNI